MYKGKNILGFIPARGGSKGLPGKNLKPLLGKPLIAWTIEQALKSRFLDLLIVSTDDKIIADVSKQHGAGIPFMRPEDAAKDDSPVSEAVLHALNFFENKGDLFDIIVMLECTSPMRYEDDIDNVITRLVDEKDATSVVGMVECANEHPSWTFKLSDGYMVSFIPESSSIQNYNRQLLETAYIPYSIYASWCGTFKEYKKFYQPRTLPYILKREQKVEIDDELDFYLAECILKRYYQ